MYLFNQFDFLFCLQLIESGTNQPELDTIAKYYFDGQGKALRPMVALLMARAINYHIHKDMRYVFTSPVKQEYQQKWSLFMVHHLILR